MFEELKPLKNKLLEIFERLKHKSQVVGKHNLMLQWIWIVTLWIGVWLSLVSLSQISKAVTYISVGLLAVHIANWLHQAIKSAIPKTYLKNTDKKAVLITGCDTGFGHELALRLDKIGFKVFAGCLFPEGTGACQLRGDASDRLEILELDVTNEQTITKAYQYVKKYLEHSTDRLWALVNNAGIAAVTEIEWCPLEVYRKVFDVNTLGLIRITKAFLPLVRQNEGNRIVIVSSLAGRYTFPGFTAYSMSKHAAISFADGLRLEMRKWKVSVHTVEPTLYKTRIADSSRLGTIVEETWAKCPEEIRKSYGKEYLEDFKATLMEHIGKAKPIEKIHEVIDDLVHAVAGEDPKLRYIPSLQTALHAHILSSLPVEVLDNLFAKGTPRTPPADIGNQKRFKFDF